MNPFFSFDDDEFFGDLLLMGAASGCGSVVQETATGNPLTFQTDIARPLKSLLIPFTPQQQGTGDPSPSNIRSIIPWNGLSVFGGGKNLLDITKTDKVNPGASGSTITIANGVISIDAVASSARSYVKFSQEFEPGTYTIQAKNTGAVSIPRLICNVEFPGSAYSSYYEAYTLSLNAGTKSLTFTLAEKAKIGIVLNNVTGESGNPGSLYDIQLEAGQTATAYEPYKPITETDISFASPVYGGTLDVVSGVLKVEWELWSVSEKTGWTMSGNEIYRDTPNVSAVDGYAVQCVCESAVSMSREELYAHRNDSNIFAIAVNNNYLRVVARENGENIFATLNDWKAYIAENPLTIVYQLATSQEIQLTPTQLTALVGTNTIWSDADGSMTAVYLKKG